MRLSKRTNTIILWVISIGLVVGMVITFTPTIGGLGGRSANDSRPALLVNGEAITELEVARARQNQLFNRVNEGQVGEDLELLMVDQLVREEVFDQAAARARVSSGEVRSEVQNFREAQGVAGRRNDQAYLQLIGQSGFDDQSFREYIRQQLRRSKYEESLTEGVEVSDAEVETYYLANADDYRDEARIRARMIVVDDAELAEELRDRAVAGEDFAVLAREFSLERADRAGALGAPQGSTEPQPVGRAALPQAVGAAAFNLQGPGVTQPVSAGERTYLVQVEEYIPERTLPLSEVEDEVRADTLAAKQAGVVRRRIDEQLRQADIEVPELSAVQYRNYPVARVGDEEIRAADLALATYTNQQIQQNLTPEFAPLIVEFFKPTILESMIERKLAYLGAERLDADFVGTEAQVAQQALAYVSRDASLDEDAVQEYYQANQRRFTVPAQATATSVEFTSQDAAEEFRDAMLDGAELQAVAEEHEGSVSDLGRVGEGQLDEALDRALFGTDAFEPLPEGEREVSDVLVLSQADEEAEPDDSEGAAEESEDPEDGSPEAGSPEAGGETEIGEESYVVLVATRTPERVRPLDEVRGEVEAAVLQAGREELQRAWLEGLREEIAVENLLAQVRQQDAGDTEADDANVPDADSADVAAGEPEAGGDGGAASEGEGDESGAPAEGDEADAAEDEGAAAED